MKWRLPKNTQIDLESYREGYVVYNPDSGSTHQLNDLAIDVLTLFQNRPMSLPELIDQLTSDYQIEDQEDLFNQLNLLIKKFDAVGLIEPFLE